MPLPLKLRLLQFLRESHTQRGEETQYHKPEVGLLGPAEELISGPKIARIDVGLIFIPNPILIACSMTDLKDCMQFTGKEVKKMRYQKPEIVSLGPAEQLILGVKQAANDGGQIFFPRFVFDSELDD